MGGYSQHPWSRFFEKSLEWPNTKAAREVFLSLLTQEQAQSFVTWGHIEIPDLPEAKNIRLGYGQHFNVQFNDQSWCALVNDENDGPSKTDEHNLYYSPAEVTMTSQLLLLRLSVSRFITIAGRSGMPRVGAPIHETAAFHVIVGGTGKDVQYLTGYYDFAGHVSVRQQYDAILA